MNKKTAQLSERPPIIVVMGHIDHGKSTLLDYIRKTNIVDKEAGGITQHLSAYEVNHKTADGDTKKITFLDTPGHEAFSDMRSRGANIADIAVLVVSAEDGVKAQTLEALRSIQDAGIPYIVAINKIDKAGANIDRTKQSLMEAEIFVEGYGGDIPCIPLSAKTGESIPDLLDMMLLISEMEELEADHDIPAEGIVIESNMDPKKGVSATLIIENGTLKKGMYVVAEDSSAPVRIMENFLGKHLDEATFSSPIRIIGFNKVPPVGSSFTSHSNKKEAEKVASSFTPKTPEEQGKERGTDADKEIIPIIIKSDVLGTLEAVESELAKITHERVKLKILHKGVGAITENDVKVASGSPDTIIIGFHTEPDASSRELALRYGVTIKTFEIIYKLTEWLEEEVLNRAPKVKTEEESGEVKIIRVFSATKYKQVVGGKVKSGTIRKGDKVKILRRDIEVGEGKVLELQQAKAKATEVSEGFEFGSMVESKTTIAEGDKLIPYTIVVK